MRIAFEGPRLVFGVPLTLPYLDPCITTGEPAGSYPPYDDGTKLDIWVKNSSGQPLTAKVWPAENCNFPDFSNPVAQVGIVKQGSNNDIDLKNFAIWLK